MTRLEAIRGRYLSTGFDISREPASVLRTSPTRHTDDVDVLWLLARAQELAGALRDAHEFCAPGHCRPCDRGRVALAALEEPAA